LIIQPTAACEDERQFVRHGGQEWTTLKRLAADHHNRLEVEAPRLPGIGITLLDGQTAAELNARGGIRAIAISHPHYYTTMVDWAERFDAQIFLHTADREWVMRKSSRIRFWEGTTLSLWDGLTPINCGGHFEGGAVLHWPAGANGKGALLTGDIIQVVQDRRYVSFMRSYPNLIPLGAGRDPTYSRKDRTILIRTNLRRVVESERSLRCKSGGAPFSRTVPPRHQFLNEQ